MGAPQKHLLYRMHLICTSQTCGFLTMPYNTAHLHLHDFTSIIIELPSNAPQRHLLESRSLAIPMIPPLKCKSPPSWKLHVQPLSTDLNRNRTKKGQNIKTDMVAQCGSIVSTCIWYIVIHNLQRCTRGAFEGRRKMHISTSKAPLMHL